MNQLRSTIFSSLGKLESDKAIEVPLVEVYRSLSPERLYQGENKKKIMRTLKVCFNGIKTNSFYTLSAVIYGMLLGADSLKATMRDATYLTNLILDKAHIYCRPSLSFATMVHMAADKQRIPSMPTPETVSELIEIGASLHQPSAIDKFIKELIWFSAIHDNNKYTKEAVDTIAEVLSVLPGTIDELGYDKGLGAITKDIKLADFY